MASRVAIEGCARRWRGSAPLLLLLVALAAPAGAQTTGALFVPLESATDPLPDVTGPDATSIIGRAAVAMRLDRLVDAAGGPAARVLLNVESNRWVARFDRADDDAHGFRSWVGTIDGLAGSHVVFTERDGVVSGLIDALSSVYRLRTVRAGSYLLERLDPGRFRPELAPIPGRESGPAAGPALGAVDDGSTLDVLVLYTPQARAQAGGIPQIQALAAQVMSDGNTILGRSGVATRLRLASATEFGLVEAPAMTFDLLAVRDSPVAQGLRDAVRADVVQLLVSSPDPNACGVAVQLTSPLPAFEAYSVADIGCVGQYTPTHELGHNLGSHHAPEDGAFDGVFPYSYGYKDPARAFRTVMALQCAGGPCPRIPQFSNPLLSHGGAPTGTPGQNNALSLVNIAATAAGWRQGGGTTSAPPAPTGLQSHVSGSLVSGSWAPTPTAYSYTLQIGSAPGGSDVFNAPIGVTTAVAGHMPPGQYVWRVIAHNVAGASAPSADASFVVGGCPAPSTPHDLTATVQGQLVSLSWSPPPAGETVTGYHLEVGSATGLSDLYSGPTGSASPGGVAAAPPGTYYVRVRARNGCGISAASNEYVVIVQ